MARLDEQQEAIARIRMAIDKDQKAEETVPVTPSPDYPPSTHWSFGAPCCSRMNTTFFECEFAPKNCCFRSLDSCLRAFLLDNFPGEQIQTNDDIWVGSKSVNEPF